MRVGRNIVCVYVSYVRMYVCIVSSGGMASHLGIFRD